MIVIEASNACFWADPTITRLRLEVSSRDFPRFDRNLNTGETMGMGTRKEIATQTVYPRARYPSHVVLPLIPRNTDTAPTGAR